MRTLAGIIFFLAYLSLSASAQNYAFTPIDANKGLSGNKVRNITQIPDGRMVITTEGLVNIYDGSAFSYLHYSNENSTALSDYSGFHHDYVADGGYMWLKNQHRLFLIDINRDRFAKSPDSVLRSWSIREPLADFFMDCRKNLWLVTKDDNLFFLRKGSKKKELFLRKISQLSGNEDKIQDLAVWNEKLYLFFQSGILTCFDLDTKKELYRQQSFNEKQRGKFTATSFVVQGKSRFFQLRNGTAGGTMLSYDIGKKKWETILETSYWLNYLSIDNTGEIWVTCREGMWHLNPGLNQKEFIPKLKLADGKVINTEVSTIYNDNQGGMWLGTLNRGLLYYHPDRFRFKNIGKSLFPIPDDATLNVTCFAEFKNGEIALGTRQGLFLYNNQTGIIRRHPAAGNLSCNALLRDSKKRVWIGTNGKGLFCIEPTGTLRQYPASPSTIYSILEHKRSNLILSTAGAGFGVFNPGLGQYKQIRTVNPATYNTVYQMVHLSNTAIAGICPEGYFVYDMNSERTALYPQSKGCNAILIDKDKQTWLATQDGLQVHDLKARKKMSFYTGQGLINNYIQAIAQDKDGAIWASTSGGLTKISRQKKQGGKENYSLASFNPVDGVISNEFWERAVYIANNGTIFWGGTDGFNILPPKGDTPSSQVHYPLFVNFLLFNKKVEGGQQYDNKILLKQPLPLTKEITLNHDQNFFSLEFAALNYVNPSQTYYRYQLQGIDQKEQEIQSADGRGRFNYTNIPPGIYHFKVRAANNNKNWGKYVVLTIIVKAPFWKTRLAYFSYLIFAICITATAIRLYLNRKRRKLVREQKERLSQMKSAFLQNFNEELSDPLTQILNPLEKILKHTDEGRLQLQLKEIHSNAVNLKERVDQLSEGVLTAVPEEENALNMDVLILNMRRLLEDQQVRKENAPDPDEKSPPPLDLLSVQDEKLIQRALTCVENNLDNPNYSVELLSKDMGMDRTGLYRKLVHVIGKTPTSFIRSVRLKRAALLLEEGLSVAEVADKVGFNTSSYLTKCFQEEFGMKPSQYLASLRKQDKKVQN